MYDQDQLDEIEALSSIYADEFQVEDLSIVDSEGIEWMEDASQSKDDVIRVVSVTINPQPNDDEQIHVGVKLYYGMTKSYPNDNAALQYVKPMKGLSASQLNELKRIAQSNGQENIGAPAMYVVVDALKEWLQANNIPGQDGSMYSDMMRRMQSQEVQRKVTAEKAAIFAAADAEVKAKSDAVDEAELEIIRKRQAGTAVTVETFMAWKKKFEEEMALLKLSSKVSDLNSADAEKLSGKQWFFVQEAAGKDINASAEEEELLKAGEGDVVTMDQEYDDDEDEEDDDEEYVPSDEGDDDDEEDDEDSGNNNNKANVPPPVPPKNSTKK